MCPEGSGATAQGVPAILGVGRFHNHPLTLQGYAEHELGLGELATN